MVALITQYGLALVFANVFIQQIGLPIPAVPTLIVAGTLAADGKLSALAIFTVAFIACAVSDVIWYGAGRLYGRRVTKLLCQMSPSPSGCLRQSELLFDRWGRLTLVLAKFVPGVSIIMPPLAGTMRLSWWSFALLDGLGAAIWTGVAIGLGMWFHHGITRLILRLEGFETAAMWTIGVLLAGYIAIKWWQRRRLYKTLRMARITVHELQRLRNAGQRPLIVDARTSAGREQERRFIPGALMLDVAEVDQWLERLPTDRDIVFYCTCPDEAGAVSVARKLMDLGYTRVRPLLGGLDAWIAAGHEVESPAVASGEGAAIDAASPA